jgi:hypothetical protein
VLVDDGPGSGVAVPGFEIVPLLVDDFGVDDGPVSGVAVPGFEIVPLFASPPDSGGGGPVVGSRAAPDLWCTGAGSVRALCSVSRSVGPLLPRADRVAPLCLLGCGARWTVGLDASSTTACGMDGTVFERFADSSAPPQPAPPKATATAPATTAAFARNHGIPRSWRMVSEHT